MTDAIVTEAEPAETAKPTAVIFSFPSRPKPAAPQPEDRLTAALASLNVAMAGQRAAMVAWRGALGELKASTKGLDDSLQRYRSNLKTLGTSVSALQAKARTLEEWAEAAAAD